MLTASVDSHADRYYRAKRDSTLSAESPLSCAGSNVRKWLEEARQGNRESLGRLLDAFRPYLLLVANKELTPKVQVKVSPSDIVQETMMEAGCFFSRFQGKTEKELIAWLRSILLNIVSNTQRYFGTEKRQINREVSLAEASVSELQNCILDRTASPSGQILASEQNTQLDQIVQQLPEHYRQVIQMHVTQRLTFVQIAAKLGITADAARKLWGRAVEELAKRMESPDESI